MTQIANSTQKTKITLIDRYTGRSLTILAVISKYNIYVSKYQYNRICKAGNYAMQYDGKDIIVG